MLNKTLYSTILSLLFLGTSVGSSYAIGVSNGGFENSCPVANKTTYLYFAAGTQVTDTVWDNFWTPNLAFIHSDISSVRFWQGNGGSLATNCTTQSNWFRVSNVSPGNNLAVNAIQNNACTFVRNNNPAVPFAQFVFNVGYKDEIGIKSQTPTTLPGGYNYYLPGTTTAIQIADQRSRIWDPVAVDQAKVHGNECLTVYARWCGDGLLTNGETCDPAAPGQSATTCDVATCKPIAPPPVNGVCNSAVNGQTYPHTTTTYPVPQCTSGTPSVTTFPTPGTTVSWTCSGTNGGSASPTCSASRSPVPVTPVCNPAKTGTQTAPVSSTDTLCNVGTASGFTATASGNTTNYTWSCNTNSAVNCSANYTTTTPVPGNFDLSIKKYAKSEDVFAGVDNTENFYYTIVVRNNGTGAVTGTTTVRDRLPAPVVLAGTPAGNGWTCSGAVGASEFTCTTDRSYAANTEFDVINIPVRVENLVFRSTGYMNYAYVQNPNEADGKQCNTDNHMPDPALGGGNGETPTAVCNEDKNNFDPATINPPNPLGFDLRLKKFVNGDDESSAVRPGTTATYRFVLQNLGTLASTGTTTVTDESFPAGVTIASIAATQGEWSCTKVSDTKFTCTTTKSYAMGEYATPIVLTANIGASMTPGTYRNVACLSNPSDPNESTVLDPSTGKYKVNNCDPAEVVIVPANSFDLSIKKYVADITTGTALRDGDHQTANDGTDLTEDILTVPSAGKVRYRFVVKNEGPQTATGLTTVEDTLPQGMTILTASGTGWACTTLESRKFTCTRTGDLAVGAYFPEIVVDAELPAPSQTTEYSNTATVKNPGDTNPANNTDPANVQIPTGFDLSLKKYISTSSGTENDAQIGSGLTLNSGLAMNYIIRVRNEGPQTTTGTTTVRDTLPTGVTLSGTVTGSGWTCTASGADIGCTTTQVVVSGAYYTDITVPVRITAGANTTVTNYAVVYNPNEENACKADGSMPAGNETACTKDPKNIDPAQFTVPGGGTPGGNYYVPQCINSVASCSTVASSSQSSCETTYGAGKCYTTMDACTPIKNTLTCSGGGGGGGGGGGTPGRCGDGVLHVGEECDVPGASWCTTSCTLDLKTNPGANPVTSLFIRIPALGKVGAAHFGKIPLTENRVVVGQNTNVFTLADEVMLDVQTQYAMPIMLPADRLLCLASQGSGLNSATICNRADKYGRVTRINGTDYVIIGGGSYQVRDGAAGAYYNQEVQNPTSSLTLFKGYEIPQVGSQVTLKHAFLGTTAGSTGSITLYNRNPATDAGGAIDLGSFDVRVSAARVGTTGTPVNRIIETLVNTTPESLLSGFLQNTNTTTTNSTRTDTQSSSTGTFANISLNGIVSYPSGLTVDELSDIPALNGNQNIRAIKGNLTVICPTNASTPFTQTGVVSVIVDGTIRFNCNTAYPSGDTTSSWAWIAQGNDIIVDQSVTNLAGVYVAIPKTPGNTVDSGRFLGTNPTNVILKIDGSLYGNANLLFSSRLYARGTSAYDILTTGTIITYSNRALVNPPPLLSQYLNNYSVERVVK